MLNPLSSKHRRDPFESPWLPGGSVQTRYLPGDPPELPLIHAITDDIMPLVAGGKQEGEWSEAKQG